MFELLLFALAGSALILLAVYADLRQRGRSWFQFPVRSSATGSSRTRSRRGSAPAKSRSGELRTQTPSRTQREQLIRLLRGDRAAAQRLVAHIQEKNPDRSERWCWEKAIYDIERDRRR